MTDSDRCHICACSGTERLSSGAPGRWITSDFRPGEAQATGLLFCPSCGAVQKTLDAAWRGSVERIYATYEPYPQGRRVEQASFSAAPGGVAMVRSERILRQLSAKLSLTDTGRLLDVGCGNGSLLLSMGRLKPGWSLNGADVGQHHKARILAQPGVDGFYPINPTCIDGQFDLVTMVHVFEHIVDPIPVPRQWGRLLSPSGILLIQVPNLTENPFDLAILDHATHFTLDVLAHTVQSAGFQILIMADDWITKELSVIAVPDEWEAAPRDFDTASAKLITERHLAWLAMLIDTAERSRGEGGFGIFGTAIAGSWLFSCLGGRVDFFVDEDTNRIGGTHFGRPILAPVDVDPASRVFMPLPSIIAGVVGERLRAAGLNIILPPIFQ